MTAASRAIATKRSQDAFLLPWYLRDLYKYLLTFAGMTIIYVGFRIYQGAFGVSAGLDLHRTGVRHALDEVAVYRGDFPRDRVPDALGISVVHARSQSRRDHSEGGDHALFHPDHVDQHLHLCSLLGRQLLCRAGQFPGIRSPFGIHRLPQIISSSSISTSRFTCSWAGPPGSTQERGCRSTPRAFRCR